MAGLGSSGEQAADLPGGQSDQLICWHRGSAGHLEEAGRGPGWQGVDPDLMLGRDHKQGFFMNEPRSSRGS